MGKKLDPRMHFVALYLLGVDEPLAFPVARPDQVWEELQTEREWATFESSGGQTVWVRTDCITDVQSSWEPADDRVQPELADAKALLEGEWPEGLSPDVFAFIAGRSEPRRASYEPGDGGDWPMPGPLLEAGEGGPLWIGWTDADGEPVLFRAQHVMALVYPTVYDTLALAAVAAEEARLAAQRGKRKKPPGRG